MVIKTLLTKRNYTPMTNKKNEYIVIHYVGAVSSAYNNAKYFEKTYRGSSAHYFVDDKEIYQIVKEGDASWHCGANSYKHKKCRNNNSIGIEMCCYKNSKGQLDVSEKVIEATAELTRQLMAKYGITEDRVIRHYDVTGKNCPAPMVSSKARWDSFKAKLSGKGIKYEVHIQDKGWQEAKENGEIAGTVGEGLRIEAIKIHTDFDVEYRCHVQDKGWMPWVKNGELSGTTGESKRVEAIEIKSEREIIATAHVQDIGWQTQVVGKEIKIGTEDRALRLEALTLEYV